MLDIEKIAVRELSKEEKAQRREGAHGDRAWRFVPTGDRAKHAAWRLKKLVDGLCLMRAQALVAFIYGYDNWGAMLKDKERGEVDVGELDEYLGPEVLACRLEYQARRVHQWLDLDLERSRHLIDLLRPSAEKEPGLSVPANTAGDLDGERDEQMWRRLNNLS